MNLWNIHFLVMETHLSAYITIRKKFIKNTSEIVKDDANDSVKHNNISVENVNIKIQMENGLLKQEITDVKTNYAKDLFNLNPNLQICDKVSHLLSKGPTTC